MGDKKGEGGDLSLEQKNINSYLITNTYPNENISLIFLGDLKIEIYKMRTHLRLHIAQRKVLFINR